MGGVGDMPSEFAMSLLAMTNPTYFVFMKSRTPDTYSEFASCLGPEAECERFWTNLPHTNAHSLKALLRQGNYRTRN